MGHVPFYEPGFYYGRRFGYRALAGRLLPRVRLVKSRLHWDH
jgi:hypothetical protein